MANVLQHISKEEATHLAVMHAGFGAKEEAEIFAKAAGLSMERVHELVLLERI